MNGPSLDRIHLSLTDLIEGDVAAAAVFRAFVLLSHTTTIPQILISFGAVLGRLGPVQLFIMVLFEVVFFALNFWIGVDLLGALDAGRKKKTKSFSSTISTNRRFDFHSHLRRLLWHGRLVRQL